MKRGLSLILALAMVMSLFTTAAFAEDTTPEEPDASVVTDVTFTAAGPTASQVKYYSEYDPGEATLTVYYYEMGVDFGYGTFTLSKDGDADVVVTNTPTPQGNSYDYTTKQLTFTKGTSTYAITINPVLVNLSFAKKDDVDGAVWTNNGKDLYFLHATENVGAAHFNATATAADSTTLTTAITIDGSAVKVAIKKGVNTLFTVDSGYTVTNKAYYAGTVNLNVPGTGTLGVTDYIFAGTPGTIYKLPGNTEIANLAAEAANDKITFTAANNCALNADTLAKFGGATVKTAELGDAAVAADIYVKLAVTKLSADLTVSKVNGSYASYVAGGSTTSGSLLKLVADEIKKDYEFAAATPAPTLSKVVLTVPATSSTGIKVYDIAYASTMSDDNWKNKNGQDSIEVNNSTSVLTVITTPGYVNKLEVPYIATATDGTTQYSGTITFKSDYADATSSTQYAPFHRADFYLDAISGVHALAEAGRTTPYTSAHTLYTNTLISPNGKTANWPLTYTAYSASGVARQHTVTFVPCSYDLLSYVEDGGTPFDSDYIEAFAAAVVAEQESTVYSGYLDSVSVSSGYVKKTNAYAMYYGGKALTYISNYTPAQIDAVVLDVLKTGVYEIPFTATYKYYASRSTTTVSTRTVPGTLIIHAGSDGDLQYEVTYGDTVTFDSADFQYLYKKLTNSRYELSYVTVDALPQYGALYSANRTTNAYKVSAGDVFYVDPRYTQSDLDYLTYWAATAYSEEYSVFVPMTMHGTGATVTVIVEIVINGDIPFVDVAKNSTFYDYIRYCYNHDIMGGKSATKFDAKSNISRIQLVVTMYRMAGSPTNYNNKTVPFTDVKGLNTEFSNALKWAYAKGIATGSGNKFNPNSPVTRQAMVTILYRYAKSEGYDVDVWSNSHLGNYTDGGQVSKVMQEAMNWALENELLSGSGSKLLPGNGTSRGAAAKILANFHATYVD